MYSSGVKPGEIPPIYDEVMLARKGQEIRHASSSMPWWNPRYWRKRIWAAIIIVILVIVIIIVAVAVERARKNMYPDYSPLSYTLKDTCKCLSPSTWIYKDPLTTAQMEVNPSLTSSTISQDTTPVRSTSNFKSYNTDASFQLRASYITFQKRKQKIL